MESKMARKRKGHRQEFYACNAVLLDCTPGHLEHARGKSVTTVALGRSDGEISNWVLYLADTRKLAVQLLVSLATSHDAFAIRLLEEHFPSNASGDFQWPKRPYDCS